MNEQIIGSKVIITIDRPIHSIHPNHQDIIYEVNYGYCEGVMGGDNEYQDAYILGIDYPIETFEGIVIGIIEREDDNETKWIVTKEGVSFTDEEILKQVHFQEQYFKSKVVRK